jgi:hypothetical protein
MCEPTEEQIERAAGQLVDHMSDQLQAHGMDASPEAVRAACRERLRARMALQGLVRGAPAAVDTPPAAD